MAPLIVLVATCSVALIITALRSRIRSPDLTLSLRAGVGAMFLLTGVSHFVGMRADMIAMVPEGLPFPELAVSITGALELAAAVAMFSRRLTPWAATGLTALLIVVFPANVNLALTGADLAWTSTLVPRTIIQLIYLTATIGLAVRSFAASRHRFSTVREQGDSL